MAINNTVFYDVDYESIKANLRYYLQNNSVLTDYNFEGSAISTWINLMSYIIFYVNSTANFVANELFIASASIDSNIYKHAYQLNYLPKRKKAITLNVKVEKKNNPDFPIKLDRFTNFKINDINFVTLDEYQDLREIEHIVLYEGEIVDTNKLDVIGYPLYYNGENYETFTVPDKENVDRNYFKVYTINKNQETQEWTSVFENKNYYQAHNYFIRYLDSFQIMFDQDDSLFSLPNIGDNIQIIYLRTTGALNNGVDLKENEETHELLPLEVEEKFEYSEYVDFIPEEKTLNGGLDEESLQSIAIHAPLFYTTGGRCVTEDDYNNLMYSSDLHDLMTDTIVYSGHKDVVDYDENPQKSMTQDTKLDKGFYIWSAFKKEILNSEETLNHEINYTFPKYVDFRTLYEYFDNYRFMQVFGKFRMSNILQIKPNIYFTYKRGNEIKPIDINNDIQNFLVEKNFIGYNKSVNQTDLVDYLRDTYNYLNYITVDFKTNVVSSRPFVSLILSSVDNIVLDKTTPTTFSCENMSGIIYRVDEMINRIVVRIDDDCKGHFDSSFVNKYVSINSQLTNKTIVKEPFDKIIIRLNKFTLSLNGFVDGKYLACEPYDGTVESNKIVFKSATSLDDLVIDPSDQSYGTIYYKEGYIELDNVFEWDDYLALNINVLFADGKYDNIMYRKNDISVFFETALDFSDCEFSYDVEN